MTIREYSGLMPGVAIKTYDHSETTLADWLDANFPAWREKEVQPAQATVNGEPLPVAEWESRRLASDDAVALVVIAHGGAFDFVGGLLGKVFGLAFGWLMPGRSAAGSSGSTSGERIETSAATANQAKLGSAVPELFGRHIRYPDYLVQPRRYFASDREQILEFLCCVGPGQYQINPDEVCLGDTPFSSFDGDAQYWLFEPGDDVSGNTAHQNWYNVDAVGGTSNGTAGLELSSDTEAQIQPPAGTYTLSGNVLSLDPNAGQIPSGWGSRTSLTIVYDRNYVIARFGNIEDGFYSTFTGDFSNATPLQPGTEVAIEGASIPGPVRIKTASLDAQGVGVVRLEHYESSTQTWEDVDFPAQNRVMRFSDPGRYYMITGRTDQSVTVQPHKNGNPIADWTGWATDSTPNIDIGVDGGTVFGEWTAWIRGCPINERTERAEIDVFFPEGLAQVEGNDDIRNKTVGVELEWRDASGVHAGGTISFSYTRATIDQIGVTEVINLPSCVPEFRLRREGETDASANVLDTVQWYGFRTLLPGRVSYPNWTTMAVRLRTGGKLAAASENQINLIATRILPVMASSGAWIPPQPTRDISAAMRYIVNTVGYTDADIDADELARLHNLWTARGDTFNYVFDETTAKEALSTVLGAGFAEFTLDDGIIRPVRDEPRTVWEQGYSPQNMTGLLKRSFTAPGPDDHDGVEVEFMNAETWTKDVVQCRLPGDQGIKVLKIKADGVTDRTRAWRIGMRKRREMFYQRWSYAFETELDAMNSRYLSYVPLFDTTPGRGQACLLRHISDAGGGRARLVCTEPLEWEAGESHVVGYRSPDGRVHGPFPAEQGSSEYEVIAALPQPWPAVSLKLELPHIYFGTEQRWAYPALISSIRPSGNEGRASVQAKNYAWQVYLDDNNEPEPI